MALFADDGSWSSKSTGASSFSRRPRSVTVGWILLAVAFVVILILGILPAPYVIEQPGPAYNTLGLDKAINDPSAPPTKNPLITIPGQKTYPTSGSLDLLTVSLVGNPKDLPSWMEVVGAWFDPSKAVVPVDVAFPPSASTIQVQNQQNAALMVDSQKDAVAAALNTIGHDFPQAVEVKQISSGFPAAKDLKVGDEIVSVNGKAVPGVQSLRDAITANGVGKPAQLGVLRNGKVTSLAVTPTKSQGAVVLGVGVGMDYSFPFDVKIQLDNVGGPSAGMMFALGIIDKLTPGKLNGGARVAGTGTIDNEGNVGAIGGIQQKLYGARHAGATWFLAPASNCDEVKGHIPGGLKVFAVKTLKDSLAVLSAIRTGGSTAGLPTCDAG